MESQKFSVIVPVYNVEQYLEACICSVLNQTYKNFEIILVDDGSSDGSGEICDFYGQNHPDCIKTLHTPNRGPVQAREEGVNCMTGDVILFLDSDDCLRREALECLNTYFCEFNSDMVLFNSSNDLNYEKKFLGFPYEDKQVFYEESKKQVLRDIITGLIPNSLCLKAVKRDLYDLSWNHSEYRSVRHGEDLLVSAFLMDKAKRIAVCDQNLYFYRQREGGSLTTSFDPSFIESVKIVHSTLEARLDSMGIADCRQLHYRRVVKSWINATKQILKKSNIPTYGDRKAKFREYSTCELFLRAYAGMDKAGLNKSDYMVAWCLRHKQFFLLAMAEWAVKILKYVK